MSLYSTEENDEQVTVTCHRCNGTGSYLEDIGDDPDHQEEVTCQLCDGTGSIDKRNDI